MKLLKNICFILFLTIISIKPCLAQTIDSLHTNISMNKAIEIAKKKGYYSIKDNNITPTIIFNEAKAQWEISSTLYNHSNKGNCKFTNGCTIVTKTFICIDAKKGKVNEKHKNEESFPNYE